MYVCLFAMVTYMKVQERSLHLYLRYFYHLYLRAPTHHLLPPFAGEVFFYFGAHSILLAARFADAIVDQ